jgi:membrane-bound lytic murein transglycosylase F
VTLTSILVFFVATVAVAFFYLLFTKFGALSLIQHRGTLKVLTLNSPTTYYQHRNEKMGFEYDLISRFANALGVDVKIVVKESMDDIYQAMERGEADIAAAGIVAPQDYQGELLFSHGYQQVYEQFVCRRGSVYATQYHHMKKWTIKVIEKSMHVQTLQTLQKKYPTLTWEEAKCDQEMLFNAIDNKELECTLTFSHEASQQMRFKLYVEPKFNIGEAKHLVWMMPKGATLLKNRVNNWLNKVKEERLLVRLEDKYYGHIERFNYFNARAFIKRMETRLPKYIDLFKKAAKKHDLPWELIAAQSYQESHWDPLATSKTGVRGLMMVTNATARDLKLTNRLDPVQSIYGGVRYLKGLMKRIKNIQHEDERIYFALAAYNVGIGHLNDARRLAKRLGKNPNVWYDVKSVLPNLAREKYFKYLRYGYARGYEPVDYVDGIKEYRDLLITKLNQKAKLNSTL